MRTTIAGDIDYAALSTALSPAQQELMPDAKGVPTIGYGIIPYYNVRGIDTITQPSSFSSSAHLRPLGSGV
jgi:hypothetical protein